MNRDKKLGLALGVLLVGIVSAFFFRNEPSRLPALPRLENPKALDDRIAEKPMVPYLVESEPAPRKSSPAAPVSNTSRREWTIETEDPWEAPTDSKPAAAGKRPRPEPIRLDRVITDNAASAASANNREWSVAPEKPKSPPIASNAMRMHEVKNGETLSGISVKYLGTQNRYPEILEANRDQLKAPKDLRAGMKIRIPPRQAERTATNADRPSLEPIERARSKPQQRSENRTPGPVDEHVAGKARLTTRQITSSPEEEPPARPEEDDRMSEEPAEKNGVARLSPGIEALETDEQPFGSAPQGETRGLEPSEAASSTREPVRRFQPAPRNPFLPGKDPAPPAHRPSSSANRSLSQRPPDDFPAWETSPSSGRTAAPPTKLGSTTPKPTGDTPVQELPARTIQEPSAGSSRPSSLAPGRYLVRKGDTLERIAQRLFGNREAASKILDANRDVLKNADDLREGMSLKIPL